MSASFMSTTMHVPSMPQTVIEAVDGRVELVVTSQGHEREPTRPRSRQVWIFREAARRDEVGFAIWCHPLALTRGQGAIEPGGILDALVKVLEDRRISVCDGIPHERIIAAPGVPVDLRVRRQGRIRQLGNNLRLR